ncbi:RrF2 family transcriptional regulator [Viridibacillus arvi]|uniref:RrF2 family transcriptional regulator n=1 Tax=Viridibacillus arvi TaxID=263475 RepID=UPI003D0451CC
MSTAKNGVHIGPPRFKIAVHSIVWLAKSGNVLSSTMIANQVDSHATFIRRVMQSLAEAGIVGSKGGREGGYSLKKSAPDITLGDIYAAVNTFEADQEFNVDCGDAGEQLDLELEKILFEVEQRTIDYLQQYTIADVMERVDFFDI